MQSYFSHIPGTIDYSDINPDVLVAQDDLAIHVGDAIVEKAINHYHSDDYNTGDENSESSGDGSGDGSSSPTIADLDELVFRVQAVVTLYAYRDYAQNNDATHTATGRTARSDKESDVLNLRLIDADDLALQRKGQRALERLIKYIDEKKFTEWTGSPVYSQTRELFLWNAELFDRYFPIEKNNRLYLMVVPMIRKAQIDHITTRLSAEVYDDLLTKVRDGELTDSNDQFLFDLVGYPIAELAMSEAFLKLPVQLFPEKMAQQFWGPGNGASAIVLREKLIKDIELKGLESLRRLEDELTKRDAEAAETPITDDSIVDIAERMSTSNLYARV